MPLTIVVHSREISGMQAITNATAIRTHMKWSMILRRWMAERVGRKRSKSISGAPSIGVFSVFSAAVITQSLSR